MRLNLAGILVFFFLGRYWTVRSFYPPNPIFISPLMFLYVVCNGPILHTKQLLNNYLANLLNVSILWLGDLFSTVHFQFLLNSTVLNSLDNSLHIHLNCTIRRKCDQLDNYVLKNAFVGHAYIVFFSHIAVLSVENRPRWSRTTLHFGAAIAFYAQSREC